uniref:SWIM-type domain-containing protein n=1 Tax=Panagrellus redivivus TaxID=6233 RepID=A0A7E4W5L4_PANRE
MSSGVSECSCRRINWKCPTVIRILDRHLIHNRPNEETLKVLHEHTSVLCSNSVFRKHVATRRRKLFSKEEHVNVQYIMDNVAKDDSKDGIKLSAEKMPATQPSDFNVVASIDTTVAAYWKRRRLEQDGLFLETTSDLSNHNNDVAYRKAVSTETRYTYPKTDNVDSSSKMIHQNSSHAPSNKVPPAMSSQKPSHSEPKADDTLLLKLNQQNSNHTTSNDLPTTTPSVPSRLVTSHLEISDGASSSSKAGLQNNSHGLTPGFSATINHPLAVSHSFSTFPKTNDGASSSKVPIQSHGKPFSFTQFPMMNHVASSSKPAVPSTMTSASLMPHPKTNHGALSSTDPFKLPSMPFYDPPRRFILDEAERVRFSKLIRKNAHFVEAPPNMPIVKNLLDHFRYS